MNLKEEVKQILRQRKERIRSLAYLFKNNIAKQVKDKKEEKSIQNIIDLLD